MIAIVSKTNMTSIEVVCKKLKHDKIMLQVINGSMACMSAWGCECNEDFRYTQIYMPCSCKRQFRLMRNDCKRFVGRIRVLTNAFAELKAERDEYMKTSVIVYLPR